MQHTGKQKIQNTYMETKQVSFEKQFGSVANLL